MRTAQAAMRHSDPKLTANVYTDPRLLDVRGALDALPVLSLDGPHGNQQRAASAASPLAPDLAPTSGISCRRPAFSGRTEACVEHSAFEARTRVSGNNDRACDDVSWRGSKNKMVGDTGLEPVTPCMSSKYSNQLS